MGKHHHQNNNCSQPNVKFASNTNITDGSIITVNYSPILNTVPASSYANVGPIVSMKTNTTVKITLTAAIYVLNPTTATTIACMSYQIADSKNNIYPVDTSNNWGPDDLMSLADGFPIDPSGINSIKASATYIIRNLKPGTNTFTAMYRSQSDANVTVSYFNTRSIIVELLD